MVDYLTHYYRRDTPPFSQSFHPADDEALQLMTGLCNEHPLRRAIQRPAETICTTGGAPNRVRAAFSAKGGQPRELCIPSTWCSFPSPWIKRAVPAAFDKGIIRIPLRPRKVM